MTAKRTAGTKKATRQNRVFARATSDVRIPERFTKEYPIHDGPSYLLKGIPPATWASVIAHTDTEGISVRFAMIRLLERFAEKGIPLLGPITTADSRTTRWRRRRKATT